MKLSQQAIAGACPELLPLMEVPGMTAAQARALHRAGLNEPEMVARAPAVRSFRTQELFAAFASS